MIVRRVSIQRGQSGGASGGGEREHSRGEPVTSWLVVVKCGMSGCSRRRTSLRSRLVTHALPNAVHARRLGVRRDTDLLALHPLSLFVLEFRQLSPQKKVQLTCRHRTRAVTSIVNDTGSTSRPLGAPESNGVYAAIGLNSCPNAADFGFLARRSNRRRLRQPLWGQCSDGVISSHRPRT